MKLFETPQEQLTSDDYYTPAWLFEDMGVEFDLDVASPPGGVPWIPAKRFLTMAEDGLSTPWEGRVWMNPPYSAATPWVTRFLDHGNGIALLPVTGGPRWVEDMWREVDGIVMLQNNMKFVRPGQIDQKIMFRSCLWALGGWAVEAIGRVGHVR